MCICFRGNTVIGQPLSVVQSALMDAPKLFYDNSIYYFFSLSAPWKYLTLQGLLDNDWERGLESVQHAIILSMVLTDTVWSPKVYIPA